MVSPPTKPLLCTLITTVFGYLLAMPASAQEYNPQRAHFNYQMFCQGCHAPDGAGSKVVPTLKNFVGNYLLIDEGREFLVRVPGSATSVLNDEHLAEVLNYILINFAGRSASVPFTPYQKDEVAQLRQKPLNEVVAYRAQLVEKIKNLNKTRENI